MKALLRIALFTFRHKWQVLAVYASTVGATAAYMLLPRLLGEAVDQAHLLSQGGGYSESAVLGIGLAILATGAVRGVFSFSQTYLGEALGQNTVYELRDRFYDHVQRLSFSFHDEHHTGNLMSRAINDLEAIRLFVNVGLVQLPYLIALFVIVATLQVRLDWRLGLINASFIPIVGLLSVFMQLYLGRVWMVVMEVYARLSTVLQESLTGIRVVKAFASEDLQELKFRGENIEVSRQMVRAAQFQALTSTMMVLSYMLVIALALWYGGSRVGRGSMSPGEFAQFLFYMQILMVPMRNIGPTISCIARAVSAGRRLFEIMDTESAVREKAGAPELRDVHGHIRFEDVTFAYRDGTPVLNGINVDAEGGKLIALVGPPGSGKSTLVSLIARFYDVTSGRITIDGVDIRDVTLSSLRRSIGIVQQDVFLFAASIRENIAYGRPDAPMEDVLRAAKTAHLDEFVSELEEGYETIIGERGVSLSGGQRQSLSIARALLIDPPVLILDDSTSSLDAGTEELIRRAMEAVTRGKTTFVIAQRLGTVQRADEILVTRDGPIVERGKHDDLLSRGGFYREIYELQLRPQEEVMLEFEASDPAIQET